MVRGGYYCCWCYYYYYFVCFVIAFSEFFLRACTCTHIYYTTTADYDHHCVQYGHERAHAMHSMCKNIEWTSSCSRWIFLVPLSSIREVYKLTAHLISIQKKWFFFVVLLLRKTESSLLQKATTITKKKKKQSKIAVTVCISQTHFVCHTHTFTCLIFAITFTIPDF